MGSITYSFDEGGVGSVMQIADRLGFHVKIALGGIRGKLCEGVLVGVRQ